MNISEIKRINEICKDNIQQLEDAGLGHHILSVQRDYVRHVEEVLKAYDCLVKALNDIDTHGIAVEEVSHDELVEFIGELKQIADDALTSVGERLVIKP